MKLVKLHTLLIVFILLVSRNVDASTYGFPLDKQPELSLREASKIAESLISRLEFQNGFYAYSASLGGDKEESGAGSWFLMYRNTEGVVIHVTIRFPEDCCHVMIMPKEGGLSERGYTRDGQVSQKWIEWQEKLQRDEEEHEKVFGPAQPKN